MTPELAQDFAAYNAWMNEKVYECASRISESDLKCDRGAFFSSIHGTLNHLLVVDKIWMGRFTGHPFNVESLDQELHSEFGALLNDRVETDAAISSFVADLTPEKLSGKLCYTSIVNPEPRQYELWLAIAHLFNHQAHHRGQVTTLLSQSGVDAGVTDLIFLPGLAERSAT